MYDIFTTKRPLQYGSGSLPYFEDIKRHLRTELQKVLAYYRSAPSKVPNDHLLVKLLSMITVPTYYEPDQYVTAVMARSDYLGRTLGMTSDIHQGTFFEGVFYGAGSQELVLSISRYFDALEIQKKWTSVSSVEVHLHPFTDLEMLPPYGSHGTNELGLSVISVDIPLMAFQYKCYLDDGYRRQDDPSFLNPGYFVHRYILPNMLYRHIDIALFNRYEAYYRRTPIPKITERHPFVILDYSRKIDQILQEYLRIAPTKTMRYDEFLMVFPSIVYSTFLETLRMPEIAPTHQVQWALFLSRLRVIETSIFSLGIKSITTNRDLINVLQRSLKRLNNDKSFDHLPGNLQEETLRRIDRIQLL